MNHLDPELDVLLQMMQSDERILRSMVESMLGQREPLAEVRVLRPESPGDRGVLLEVHVRLASGEELELELAALGRLAPSPLRVWS